MYKKVFLISLLIGIVWGFAAVYIAIEHNPQMAVYKESGIYDIKYLLGLFTVWSATFCLGVFVCLSVIIRIVRRFKKFI